MRRLFALIALFTIALIAPSSVAQGEAESNPWMPEEKRAPGLSRRVFPSKTVRADVGFHIWLPPAYAREKTRRFPVLYWLHGSGGGIEGVPQLARRFDAAVREGKIPDLIVVFPWGLPEGMWLDARNGGPPVEKVFLGELLPLVDREWRTLPSPRGRILEGFSMGGYGAGHLGFRHPHLFGAVSMLAGGPLHPDFETRRTGPVGRDALLKRVYGGDMDVFRAFSPWHLADPWADSIRTRPLRIVVGARDETADYSRLLHERLDTLRIPHGYTEVPGVGHQPLALLEALGDAFWKFHRDFLERPTPAPPTVDAALLDVVGTPGSTRPHGVLAVGPTGVTAIATTSDVSPPVLETARVVLPGRLVVDAVVARLINANRIPSTGSAPSTSRPARPTTVAAVEAATGLPFEVLVRRELAGPLDMSTVVVGANGDVACSLGDVTLLIAAALRARSGEIGFLPRADWDRVLPTSTFTTSVTMSRTPSTPPTEPVNTDSLALRFDDAARRALVTITSAPIK